MRRVALRSGLELAVDDSGLGEPVLLLHAWGETHRVFDVLVALLPDRLRSIVPDQRGVGASDKPDAGYSLTDAAADMVDLLDALDIDTCWLVGTSSGGYVAQMIAGEHPDRVRGMVLIGSPSDLRGRVPPALADLLAAFSEPVTRDDVEAVNRALPLHRVVAQSYLDRQTDAALTIPKRVWLRVLEGLTDAVPPLHQRPITVPTLVLWGADDDVLPAGQPDQLARAIDECRVVSYEGTGHLVLWEQPERVAADVVEFLTMTGPSVWMPPGEGAIMSPEHNCTTGHGHLPEPGEPTVPELEEDENIAPRPEEELADLLRADPDVEDHTAHDG